MRVLALDYGRARCGCAISDPTGTVARPLPVIEPTEARAAAELARDHEAELVVIGMPIRLDGTEGAQAAETREFAAELERMLEIPIEVWDERFTTRLAEQSAREGAAGAEDSLAAAHLLDNWLAAHPTGDEA
jgi:putative Holliday junction resolvase